MKQNQVLTSSQQILTVGRLLGKGGQGRTYSSECGTYAIKLLYSMTPLEEKRLADRITDVKAIIRRHQSLKHYIAGPTVLTEKPRAGYVMKCAQDMKALQHLLRPPNYQDPDSFFDWYVLETGGLRRRLKLMLNTFSIFQHMDHLGIVYGDPSPNNLLVSSNPNFEEIFLIDSDNMHYAASPISRPLFTPRYGSPELSRFETGATLSLPSDVYALAVMSFELLCICHPFIGDSVANGTPEDEVHALQGYRPWIEHSTDHSNYSSAGLSREVVLTNGLKNQYRAMFETGLEDIARRPTAYDFYLAFFKAYYNCINCQHCGWSFYIQKQTTSCPNCETKLPLRIRFRIGHQQPGSKQTQLTPNIDFQITIEPNLQAKFLIPISPLKPGAAKIEYLQIKTTKNEQHEIAFIDNKKHKIYDIKKNTYIDPNDFIAIKSLIAIALIPMDSISIVFEEYIKNHDYIYIDMVGLS